MVPVYLPYIRYACYLRGIKPDTRNSKKSEYGILHPYVANNGTDLLVVVLILLGTCTWTKLMSLSDIICIIHMYMYSNSNYAYISGSYIKSSKVNFF